MIKYHDDYFREYIERFSTKTDIEIVAAFNSQVGNPGWCTAKSGFLSAIRHELDRRNINRDDVSNESGTSYAERASLYILNGKTNQEGGLTHSDTPSKKRPPIS